MRDMLQRELIENVPPDDITRVAHVVIKNYEVEHRGYNYDPEKQLVIEIEQATEGERSKKPYETVQNEIGGGGMKKFFFTVSFNQLFTVRRVSQDHAEELAQQLARRVIKALRNSLNNMRIVGPSDEVIYSVNVLPMETRLAGGPIWRNIIDVQYYVYIP